jgi:hypothetical protein
MTSFLTSARFLRENAVSIPQCEEENLQVVFGFQTVSLIPSLPVLYSHEAAEKVSECVHSQCQNGRAVVTAGVKWLGEKLSRLSCHNTLR